MFIVYWFFHRCSHSTLQDETVLDWCYIIKNKTSQGTSILFFSFELYQIPHMGKYFHVDRTRRTCITAYPNMVTKCKITRFLRKKWIKKWRVVVLRILRRFCGCFEKHSTGKHKENVRTVYNLFDHWNMALSSECGCLKTLLATRSVFSFEDGGLLLVLRTSLKMLLC